MKLALLSCVCLMCCSLSVGYAADKGNKKLSESQIKKLIIQESIDSYPGNCPCPYNVASNGSSCGRRSAYSRAGGYSPICYDTDVTKEMIKEWRENHK